MSRIAIGFAILLACAPVPARAQAQRPSESAALGRSLWGTIAPIGVGYALLAAGNAGGPDANGGTGAIGALSIMGGLIVGPSLGYFYAGQGGRAWKGLGVRALGFGALIGAAAASWDCYGNECATAGTVALVGSAVTLGSAIYDIASVRGAVRRRNERAQGVSVHVAPTYSSRHRAAGVALQVTF